MERTSTCDWIFGILHGFYLRSTDSELYMMHMMIWTLDCNRLEQWCLVMEACNIRQSGGDSGQTFGVC
jgi:hypothetical protein